MRYRVFLHHLRLATSTSSLCCSSTSACMKRHHASASVLGFATPSSSRRGFERRNVSCRSRRRGVVATYAGDGKASGGASDVGESQLPMNTDVQQALQSSIKILQDRDISEPEESSFHLLAHTLQLSWKEGFNQVREIHTHSGSSCELASRELTDEETSIFDSLLRRRIGHEPIQYILGRWDFHHLTGIIIREPMLCPRPETEELVEHVLGEIDSLLLSRHKKEEKIRILDVGSGTGAIGIAIANRYPNKVQVVSIDVLRDAVDLSTDNAEKFLSRHFEGDQQSIENLYRAVLSSAKDFNLEENGCERGFDIVVSNPPYIPVRDMGALSSDVLKHESELALCGGDDGLDVVRDIVRNLPRWMPDDSGPRYCWMEVDDSHPRILASWLTPGSEEARFWGVEFCEGLKDMYGRYRFAKLQVKRN